ncbi:hypothetical protein HORIV_35830 [Vreelandella olivaria]|uniref:Dienelactone hydrolase domain-containing protein n=1 Tax=Vreelandella olivaria TaxID=390919 RepID=A0ABM7GKP1_9GAMM|nr:hypothetical protein HORIV_35830 [Halomonas olivaria]
MRALTLGGLAQAREQGAAEKTVIMGYCFGGAVALEIARSGEADNIAAYSSFHGGLTTPMAKLTQVKPLLSLLPTAVPTVR